MEHQITCGFIGLGLIGGSIARALRQYHPDYRLIGYDVNREATALAASEGVLDLSLSCISSEFSSCDYIFLCAPVSFNDKNLLTLKAYLSKDCLLTDVGSVKSDIHRHIKELSLEDQFIGGHPMAGSERTGFANSKALLLQNAYYILTPTASVRKEWVEKYRELVTSLKAIPLVITCEKHDYITAAISHLPHVIAASLVNLVKDEDGSEGLMKMIAAGGFKDITRIASSSSDMWQQICLTNRDNILTLLDHYMEALSEIRTEIADADGERIYDFFRSAREYRDSFINASSGPIKTSYTLSIDIADRTGSIANVAAILAEHNISIKNIGILHNREQQEGALNIEFYAEESIEKAAAILSESGYPIHEK